MTISQNISVGFFVAGLAYWAWLLKQPSGLYRDREEHAGELPETQVLSTARSS